MGEPVNLGDQRGDLPPAGIALYTGRKSGEIAVVGESFHRDELHRILGGPYREGVRVTVWAQLVAEEGNREDSNAVAVLVKSQKVGYLPNAEARRYRKVFEEYAASGRGGFARCDIYGGWDRGWTDKGDYSLSVSLDTPARQRELLKNDGVKGKRKKPA